ncbi:hypothetical protein DV515_00018934 [Chloebia gouldiae]|uniref:Uncharacterized protein n=1 Tax=Chloebia gouldiae TaxID=44316 RepID=A0A3L8Q647_CHLGU|nr:hypothetical protein DV515_00018935 [Chloebia gouldiae]RLV62797.1 hypothetical protein DV515_00018934 [Chloebia gouldiae]
MPCSHPCPIPLRSSSSLCHQPGARGHPGDSHCLLPLPQGVRSSVVLAPVLPVCSLWGTFGWRKDQGVQEQGLAAGLGVLQLLPLPRSNARGPASPNSTVKLKLQPSPCRSLHRTLLWGEKAGSSLGLSIAGSRYPGYESHGREHVPLERISRGPDGRFVLETAPRPEPEPPRAPLLPYHQLPAEEEEEDEEEESDDEPVWHRGVSLRPQTAGQPRRGARASGHRHGRYFGYGSSSPVDEAVALSITDVSPVASAAATLPYSAAREPPGPRHGPPRDSPPRQGSPPPAASPPVPPGPPAISGILQYLSLPFFKEMCVDGDWPPAEEPGDPPAQPEPPASPPPAERTLCPDCIDTSANAPSSPAATAAFLEPPRLPPGPAKASLPGSPSWPRSPSPGPPPQPVPHLRTETPGRPPDAAAPEKLPRGSLTSQSSGRGSGSFLRPPSLAPSLGGTFLGTPVGDGGSWHSGGSAAEGRTDAGAGKRRNTSVDENYEWDAEFALESELLEALQLYRGAAPARPGSSIALRDLQRHKPGSAPVSSVSAEALGTGGPPERGQTPRTEGLGARRRREGAQQRRQRVGTRGCCSERFEVATLL